MKGCLRWAEELIWIKKTHGSLDVIAPQCQKTLSKQVYRHQTMGQAQGLCGQVQRHQSLGNFTLAPDLSGPQ